MNGTAARTSFFAPSESRRGGEETARLAGLALAELEERRFDGGEFKLRPLASVRGHTAVVFQSLAATPEAPAADRLVRLLFLLATLRDAGAAPRIALLPYLAYARKERRTQLRDPVHTRYLAELLEAAGADRIVALDVHEAGSFDNAFRIPTDHLSAMPMMADHFARRCPDAELAVVSPDVGGIKRVQAFRDVLEQRLGRRIGQAFVEKRRAGGVVSGGTLVGLDPSPASVIILDDLCATGGTLLRAADACRHAGARAVYVAVTHAPLRAGLEKVVAAESIDATVITDSVGGAAEADALEAPAGRLTCLPVAPLFGEALRRMLAGEPLAPLLRHWPVPRGT